ncbi:FAD-dependent oxidoreductase [Amycolatopsis endophytica]|uniref:D-amino-acid dehydrogenase n=1 Tax=Amycolatopsis endophytica TaxID=860233 RepID=A0A853AW54_9PSEU|nr:FAD-dependent oxidoreductase [Amycolatopsis endophytica]NYI86831.1 D-amino-acid dehydrogenase [Amycolatopsis endophytica]
MRVVVIGSGIAGASTAHQLARRGADVVVVDAGRPGVATAAGAGIVCPWTSRRGDDEYRFAAAAAAYYPDLIAQLADDGAGDTSFEVVGGMIVSADERELDEAYQRVSERAAGEPAAGAVERLDPAQTRELFPALAPDLAAVHVSGGGRVDGRRLRQALLDAAVARGARLVHGVAELTPRGVRAADEDLAADRVVIAAGAWTGDLLPALPVAPQRGQISHFELPGTDTGRWPVVQPVSSHYLLAFPGSRVVAGATRETGSGFDHRVTAAGQREVLDHALTVAPGLADATLLETRIGFRPASPDGLPLLGALEDRPDVLLATGFGPGGLTQAPFSGHLIACLALDAEVPVDLTPYRPERFTGR